MYEPEAGAGGLILKKQKTLLNETPPTMQDYTVLINTFRSN